MVLLLNVSNVPNMLVISCGGFMGVPTVTRYWEFLLPEIQKYQKSDPVKGRLVLRGCATSHLQVCEKAAGEILPPALPQIPPSQAAINLFVPSIWNYSSSQDAPHPSHSTHVLVTVPQGHVVTQSGLCPRPEGTEMDSPDLSSALGCIINTPN